MKRGLLVINEELSFQKRVECTQIRGLENRGKVFFKCQGVSGRMISVNGVRMGGGEVLLL